MSFFSKQFIDVIQWTETGDSVLAWRFPMEDQEIQSGAKLTVRDSQLAVFVNEGQIADVFAPGLYTLSTHTLPLLANLLNWDKAFKSPFKSDVYFFSSRLRMNQKWGTATPMPTSTSLTWRAARRTSPRRCWRLWGRCLPAWGCRSTASWWRTSRCPKNCRKCWTSGSG